MIIGFNLSMMSSVDRKAVKAGFSFFSASYSGAHLVTRTYPAAMRSSHFFKVSLYLTFDGCWVTGFHWADACIMWKANRTGMKITSIIFKSNMLFGLWIPVVTIQFVTFLR